MLTIRPETPADYPAIQDVHIRAFGNTYEVAALVALLRCTQSYDADLSLLAEVEGQIVGHVLFNPLQLYLNGDVVQALNLSPLGVHPDFQKQGIGGQLVEAGHRVAIEKGYHTSILLGHPEYYPRFGYQTGAYGSSNVIVKTESLPEIELETAVPVAEDVPALADLRRMNEQQVNLSLIPEQTLSEWLSPNLALSCTVYRHEGDIVGYTRGTAEKLRLFLARDDEMARAIAKKLAGDAATIKLPLHPDSLCANAFNERPSITVWDPGMICLLRDESPLNAYLQSIEKGASVGRIIWSSCFDMD